MASRTAKAGSITSMEATSKESGSKVTHRATARKLFKTAPSSKANGAKKVNSKRSRHSLKQVKYMKANSMKKVNRMAQASRHGPTVEGTKENGKLETRSALA